MLISSRYLGRPGVEVKDDRLLGVFAPKELREGLRPAAEVVAAGLAEPVGMGRLRELIAPGKKVLILSDDNTRNTPVAEILPGLVAELQAGGLKNEDLTIMVALGTHRQMTPAELDLKFGAGVPGRFRILQHRFDDEASLTDLGRTEQGTEIRVNRAVTEADVVIGLGQVVPHRVAGYSGGSKIIQPGVCGAVTTGQTHWLSAAFWGEEILGKADNPVRREMDEVGHRCNLAAIVNAVLDGAGRLMHLVCGEPVAAHRRASALSEAVYGVEIPRKAPIVITDSHPADLELWQGAKGYYSAELAVADDGVVILESPCPEGVAVSHPDVLRYGYRPYAEVKELVESGRLTNLTVAAHLVHVGRLVREKGRGILVSTGIGPEEAAKLGLLWAPGLSEAYAQAQALVSPDAEVLVFRNGGDILPVVSQRG
ncbi:MAG: nickel-dependent lactate racemase [Methanocella sp.]